MITFLLHLFRLLPVLCGSHRHLALENLALRQQLAVYKKTLSQAASERSPLLGLSIPGVGRVASGPPHRDPRHRAALAPAPLSRLLGQPLHEASGGAPTC